MEYDNANMKWERWDRDSPYRGLLERSAAGLNTHSLVSSELTALGGTTHLPCGTSCPSYIFATASVDSIVSVICSVMDLFVNIVTPNGRNYQQPTGLFINNEFVASSGQTITSLDPAYVHSFLFMYRTDR